MIYHIKMVKHKHILTKNNYQKCVTFLTAFSHSMCQAVQLSLILHCSSKKLDTLFIQENLILVWYFGVINSSQLSVQIPDNNKGQEYRISL